MEMRLELVTVPVSDIDRAKEFYLLPEWTSGAGGSGENPYV